MPFFIEEVAMQDPTIIIVYALMFVVLGLMWNNGRKRKKAALELQESLKAGAEVMLTSGIYGTVSSVADDRLTIKSGTTTLVVAKGAVMRVLPTEVKTEAKPKAAAKAPAKTTKTEK